MPSARRYFEQLLELGERDIVTGGAAPRPGRQGRASAPAGPGPQGMQRPSHGGAAARALPSLYPPGLSVDGPPPRGDLFSRDPIAECSSLEDVGRLAASCTRCPLGHSRLNAVPGEGNPSAGLVCVGEAPGQTEDETGRPFVGRAGQLLDSILRSIGLAREEVFICNVLKCRPPNNRTPEPLEVAACSPYLHRQLELIRPKVILALGKPAANTLLSTQASLGDLRGRIHRYRGIPVVVTYHPAALLRNPNWKGATWDDVRIARRILDGESA